MPALIVGTNSTFDLNVTLPTGVTRGGSFGTDVGGAPLPAGMNLSRTGLLSVGAATIGSVTGVIFTYDTP